METEIEISINTEIETEIKEQFRTEADKEAEVHEDSYRDRPETTRKKRAGRERFGLLLRTKQRQRPFPFPWGLWDREQTVLSRQTTERGTGVRGLGTKTRGELRRMALEPRWWIENYKSTWCGHKCHRKSHSLFPLGFWDSNFPIHDYRVWFAWWVGGEELLQCTDSVSIPSRKHAPPTFSSCAQAHTSSKNWVWTLACQV